MASLRTSLRTLTSSTFASSSRLLLPSLPASHRSLSTDSPTPRDTTVRNAFGTIGEILGNSSSTPSAPTKAYGQTHQSFTPAVVHQDQAEPQQQEVLATPEYTKEAIPPIVDPVLGLLVNMVMKHGRKENARGIIKEAMEEIQRTTNDHPLPLLHRAISLTSPSLRLSSFRRSSKILQLPTALSSRARTRQAIQWILKAAEKGRNGGLPRGRRIGREVLAVLEGTSQALVRKEEVHKLGAVNRSNLSTR